MELKDFVKWLKTTLENLTKASVSVLTKNKYTVKFDSNKVEVTNPFVLPKIVDVKLTNEIDYKDQLDKLVNGLKLDISSNFEKLVKETMALKPLTKVSIDNFKDIPKYPSKIEVTNPQKTVSITNFYELAKEIGKLKKSVDELPRKYPEPYKNVTVENVGDMVELLTRIESLLMGMPSKFPQMKEEISVSNLTELKLPIGVGPKDYINVRLTDGEKFYEAIANVVAGSGGGGKHAYQDATGERTYGLVDEKRRVVTTKESKWALLNYYTVADITYVGQLDFNSNYAILKVDGSSLTYATIKNNPSITNYDDAIADKENLTYDNALIAGII